MPQGMFPEMSVLSSRVLFNVSDGKAASCLRALLKTLSHEVGLRHQQVLGCQESWSLSRGMLCIKVGIYMREVEQSGKHEWNSGPMLVVCRTTLYFLIPKAVSARVACLFSVSGRPPHPAGVQITQEPS